jgi:hypothetical protein
VTKRLAAAALLFAFAAPLYADFNAVARALDRQRGVKRVWIPFLGVARFLVRAVAPEGVHDFQLATFEGADALDPRELHKILESKVGKGFTPLVQVWSRKSGEWSFIYARPGKHPDRLELLVLAHDDEDTVLVRVDINAEKIARRLNEPRNVHRVAVNGH